MEQPNHLSMNTISNTRSPSLILDLSEQALAPTPSSGLPYAYSALSMPTSSTSSPIQSTTASQLQPLQSALQLRITSPQSQSPSQLSSNNLLYFQTSGGVAQSQSADALIAAETLFSLSYSPAPGPPRELVFLPENFRQIPFIRPETIQSPGTYGTQGTPAAANAASNSNSAEYKQTRSGETPDLLNKANSQMQSGPIRKRPSARLTEPRSRTSSSPESEISTSVQGLQESKGSGKRTKGSSRRRTSAQNKKTPDLCSTKSEQPILNRLSTSMQEQDFGQQMARVEESDPEDSRSSTDTPTNVSLLSAPTKHEFPEGVRLKRRRHARLKNGHQLECAVCGDTAVSFNFGVPSCEGCKSFFRRNGTRIEELECLGKGDCEVTKDSRKCCPACRMRRCLNAGMKVAFLYDTKPRKTKSVKLEPADPELASPKHIHSSRPSPERPTRNVSRISSGSSTLNSSSSSDAHVSKTEPFHLDGQKQSLGIAQASSSLAPNYTMLDASGMAQGKYVLLSNPESNVIGSSASLPKTLQVPTTPMTPMLVSPFQPVQMQQQGSLGQNVYVIHCVPVGANANASTASLSLNSNPNPTSPEMQLAQFPGLYALASPNQSSSSGGSPNVLALQTIERTILSSAFSDLSPPSGLSLNHEPQTGIAQLATSSQNSQSINQTQHQNQSQSQSKDLLFGHAQYPTQPVSDFLPLSPYQAPILSNLPSLSNLLPPSVEPANMDPLGIISPLGQSSMEAFGPQLIPSLMVCPTCCRKVPSPMSSASTQTESTINSAQNLISPFEPPPLAAHAQINESALNTSNLPNTAAGFLSSLEAVTPATGASQTMCTPKTPSQNPPLAGQHGIPDPSAQLTSVENVRVCTRYSERNVTTELRRHVPGAVSEMCSSITAVAPVIDEQNFKETNDLLTSAVRFIMTPLTQQEAAALPPIPMTPIDNMKYSDFFLQRMIRALKLVPHFRQLSQNTQIKLLRASVLQVIKSVWRLLRDPNHFAAIVEVENESPRFIYMTSFIRGVAQMGYSHCFLDLYGFIFMNEIQSVFRNDRVLMLARLLKLIFSPHHFLNDPVLLGEILPGHAFFVEFIAQYIRRNYADEVEHALPSLITIMANGSISTCTTAALPSHSAASATPSLASLPTPSSGQSAAEHHSVANANVPRPPFVERLIEHAFAADDLYCTSFETSNPLKYLLKRMAALNQLTPLMLDILSLDPIRYPTAH